MLWCSCSVKTPSWTRQSVQRCPGLYPCSWACPTPFLSPRGRGGDSVVDITWQLRGKDTERSMSFSSSFGCIKMLLASKWPHGFAPSSPRMQPVCFWLLGRESWVSNINCVGRGCYWILWAGAQGSSGRIVLYNCTSPITLQVTSSSIIHTTLTALCLGQQDITRGKNGFCKFQ